VRAWLTRNVRVLSAVSFLLDAASELLYPLLPQLPDRRCWASRRPWSAPRDALLVVDIDDAARGRVFGFHRTMDTLGAVVGPLLGLAGYELLDHQIAPLLWVAVAPAVLSVALVFLVRESRRIQPRRRKVFAGVGELPRRNWRVTVALVAFGVVNFPDALLLLRLNEISRRRDTGLCHVQRGVRGVELSRRAARRPHSSPKPCSGSAWCSSRSATWV
jgi:hypothetical protein